MDSETNARPASFAEFGEAMVDEVFTPGFLRRVLDTALQALPLPSDLLSDSGIGVVRVRAREPILVEDDGHERCFAVTVRIQLKAEVGPRRLAVGVQADVEIDLTVRIGTFRPAIVQLDIDPVTTDDLRVLARPSNERLPLPFSGSRGTSRLADLAERLLPVISTTVNRALEASPSARRVDVLERVRRAQGGWAETVEPVTGTLEAGASLEWPITLGEQERARLQVWAGFVGESGATPATTRTQGSSVELSVSEATGKPVDRLSLSIRRTAPDLDTTATGPGLTVTARAASRYRARMVNRASRPLTFRVQEVRDTVPGERIGFAEFGEVLIQRGIDQETVSRAINDLLSARPPVLRSPRLVGATTAARLSEVTRESTTRDELLFGLSLIIDVQLRLGPGHNATIVASTLQASMSLRVSTMLHPATVLVAFAPVSRRDLRVIEAPHRVRGRRMPIPGRKLAELLEERVATELNRELSEPSLRLVPGELATEAPLGLAGRAPSPPPVPGDDHQERARGLRTLRALNPLRPPRPRVLRERSAFSGVICAAQPRVHTIQLAYQQRIRAEAMITADTTQLTNNDGAAHTGVAAELAVCDEHCGVHAAEQALIRREETTIIVIEFTAPHTGPWRLRLACPDHPGNLDYDLQVQAKTYQYAPG